MAKRLPHVITWRGFKLARNWDPDAGHLNEWRGYATLTHRGPSLGLLVKRSAGRWRACLRMPDMVEPCVQDSLWGDHTAESPTLALDLALKAWLDLINRIADGASGWDGVIS